MGEAVAIHLSKKGWKIACVDLREPAGGPGKDYEGIFLKADVTKYEEQANAFQQTWEKYGQIDFGEQYLRWNLKFLIWIVFANAGIVESFPFYGVEQSLPPPKPSFLVQDVNLVGVQYSSYLAMHYMRKNPIPGGNLIMTASGERLPCSIHLTPKSN